MKTLIILAALFTLPAFAGEKPFMEFGDIKGESETVTNTGEETAGTVKASSIDYGEKHRPETNTAKTAEPEDDWESPVRQQSVDSNSMRNMKSQQSVGLNSMRNMKSQESVDSNSIRNMKSQESVGLNSMRNMKSQQSVDSNSIRNMKRQDRKEVVDGKTNRKTRGYNSSRSNRRGDEKYSKDGQPTCNAKDTNCDDAEDK